MGVRVLELAGARGAGSSPAVVDADGVYGRLLEALGADAVLIRPAFVLYGHADRSGIAALVEGLLRQLHSTAAVTPAERLAAA